MSGEVRPQLMRSKIAPFVLLLLLGIAALYYVFGPDRYVISGAPEARLGELSAKTLALEKQGTLLNLVLTGIATSLVVISLYELLKLAVQYAVWFFSKRRLLNQFFGEGTGEHSADAEIIAQTDPLMKMLEGLVESDPKLEAQPQHRLYKARHWVNRYDIESGRAIIKLFRKEGLSAPSLKPVDRDNPEGPDKIPFKILLGLGFTDEVKRLTPEFTEWMCTEMSDQGDALSIHTRLLPRDWGSRLYGEQSKQEPKFTTLFPRRWSVKAWLANPSAVRDYALILRHNSTGGAGSQPCVYFWLAGFTDRGTAAAGRYLADHWQDLYETFVRSPQFRNSRTDNHGNFLIVIEGPSYNKDGKSERWTMVDGFQVTPADLQKFDLHWTTKQRHS